MEYPSFKRVLTSGGVSPALKGALTLGRYSSYISLFGIRSLLIFFGNTKERTRKKNCEQSEGRTTNLSKDMTSSSKLHLYQPGSYTTLVFIFNPFVFLRGSNIIENMVTMMEKHANHLEQLVEERTRQLNEEKEKTEKILYRLLPP